MSRSSQRVITWAKKTGQENVIRGYLGDVKVFVVQLDSECQCGDCSEGPWLLSSSLPGMVLKRNRFPTCGEAYGYVENLIEDWLIKSRLEIGGSK